MPTPWCPSPDQSLQALLDDLQDLHLHHDRAESFPQEAFEALQKSGLQAAFVPEALGGALKDFEGLLDVVRQLASSDLTLAIGYGKTFLGAVCTWLAGTEEQQTQLAQSILQGDVVSWGLTEEGHGSDLLSNTLQASLTSSGEAYLLNGSKHLINNATRGHQITVLARTSQEGGPRGFTLLLVDKRQLTGLQHQPLPKILTHGIRGADISGVTFKDAPVPVGQRIADEGAGLEVVLKALQLTRTLCAALSLGAVEHAVRAVETFASQRTLYGQNMLDLPMVQHQLGTIKAQRALLDVVSRYAARSVHTLPAELSLTSSLVKAWVPSVADTLIELCAELMGVRGFLAGPFEKLERDHHLVGIFDGSTTVNRQAVIRQIPVLLRALKRPVPATSLEQVRRTIQAEIPPLDWQRLSLLTSGCTVLQGLSHTLEKLPEQWKDVPEGESLWVLAQQVEMFWAEVQADLQNHVPGPALSSTVDFVRVMHLETCHAAAIVLSHLLHHPPRTHQQVVGWRVALGCLLQRAGRGPAPSPLDCQQVKDPFWWRPKEVQHA